MSQFENITYEKKDNIAIITLNRPKALNALSSALIRELGQALHDAEEDENIRAVIITGAGDRAFAAGADVSELAGRTPEEIYRYLRAGRDNVLDFIRKMTKPVIAAVNGLALGGGCELTMACDIVIASETARFGQPEINLGVTPGWGGMARLARIVGHHKAMELSMTGDMIDAQEAYRLGLVNKVVPPDKLMEEAMALAKKLAEKAPLAIKAVKDVVNMSLYDIPAMEYEAHAFTKLFATEDAQEGTKAFLEKRKPVWKGR